MDIIVKRKSVEPNLILDILTGYQNKERLDIDFKELGISLPTECEKLYSHLEKCNDKFRKMIKYYFTMEANETDRMYYLATFLNFSLDFCDLDFEEYISNFQKLTKEEVLKNIFVAIMIIDDDTIKYKDALNLLDEKSYLNEEMVIKKIDESNLSYSLKWKLYKLIKDSEQGINDIIYILEEFKRNENESYKRLLDISYNWADEIKDIFDKRGIEYLSYLDKSMDFSKMKKIYIKPISAWRSYNFEGKEIGDEEIQVGIGYNIEKTLDRFRRGKSDEWFKEVLKLLADPTRYKILKLLSKRQMYSGELATETGMSQGTISHHMSSLVLYDLVESFREDGRMYYKLNKEKFKSWVEILRKKL